MLHFKRASALVLAFVIAGTARIAEAQTPTVSRGDVKIDRMNAEKLRVDMRKLWADHVIWTREYIVNAVEADPTAEPSLKRLMKNQEDLGNAIVPYYGKDAGVKLTGLLKEHISIAGELVTAAIAKDNARVSDVDKRWHDNARAIATFLSGANPNWKNDDLVKMLDDHLSLTSREATLRLQKKWDDDVENFDRIFEQAMHMADALTAGIVKQFPDK